MDFFEKLKSKTSEVGKQAQVMIEVTRINTQIGEKRSAIRAKMEEIGREVYTRYSSGQAFDEIISGWCAEIEDVEAEIKTLNDKITELKGMKDCPGCGAKLEADSRFCPHCGATVAEEKPEEKVCPDCGAVVKAEAKFCTGCGRRLEEQQE